MKIWLWFLLFDFLFAAFLFLVFRRSRRDYGYNPNTVNYDENMQEFCYIIPKSPNIVREYLTHPDKRDSIRYIYEGETDDIYFYKDLTTLPEVRYHLYASAIRGGTYLRVVLQEDFSGKNALALRQNEFWRRKIDAMPVPYEEAGEEEEEN